MEYKNATDINNIGYAYKTVLMADIVGKLQQFLDNIVKRSFSTDWLVVSKRDKPRCEQRTETIRIMKVQKCILEGEL